MAARMRVNKNAADSRLGRLERDGSGVADDPCFDPDEAGPQADA